MKSHVKILAESHGQSRAARTVTEGEVPAEATVGGGGGGGGGTE